jgi:hypothetical protein
MPDLAGGLAAISKVHTSGLAGAIRQHARIAGRYGYLDLEDAVGGDCGQD